MTGSLPPLNDEDSGAGDPATIDRLGRAFAQETSQAQADLEHTGIPLRSPTRVGRYSSRQLPFGVTLLSAILVAAAFVLRPVGQTPNGAAPSSPSVAPGGVVAGLVTSPVPTSGPTNSPAPTTPTAREPWAAFTWAHTASDPWTGPGNRFVNAVTPWGDGFVAVGYEFANDHAHGVVWRSVDGFTWARQPDSADVFDGMALWSIAASDRRLVILGQVHSSTGFGPAMAWTSDDGVTWTNSDEASAAFGTQIVNGITYGPGGFITFGSDRQSRINLLWISPDGTTWDALVVPGGAQAGQAEGLPVPRMSVVGSPRGYFASMDNLAWISTDGRAWTRSDGANSDRLFGFWPGASGVVAVIYPRSSCPSNGICAGPIIVPTYRQSFDGINWTDLQDRVPFNSPAGSMLGGRMASNGSRILWVASSGQAWMSFDGLAWQNVAGYVADAASLQAVDTLNFGLLAIGTGGVLSIDHDSGDPIAWYGAASGLAPQGPQPTFPLRYSDGRTDRKCIGGEGGDPGVVCIQIGYYLRNDTGSEQIVRLTGAVNSTVLVPAGQTGYLTEIGPIWDSGLPLDVQLLTQQCDVIDSVTVKGDLALLTIHPHLDNPLTVTNDLPPEALPETYFPTTTTCTG